MCGLSPKITSPSHRSSRSFSELTIAMLFWSASVTVCTAVIPITNQWDCRAERRSDYQKNGGGNELITYTNPQLINLTMRPRLYGRNRNSIIHIWKTNILSTSPKEQLILALGSGTRKVSFHTQTGVVPPLRSCAAMLSAPFWTKSPIPFVLDMTFPHWLSIHIKRHRGMATEVARMTHDCNDCRNFST